ncbi:UNVERIFIED_CONTAM: putative membrane protein (TIGR02226 family) [Acetivibrio alkalicellulosi]
MTFYNPWGLFALIGIPIIIVLYLLKQRHQDYEVSSLHLWEQVIKDIEANAPWQKLKKNILMILQIICIALLALALATPFINNLGSQSENVIIVIDTSMSMQAEDMGRSRFDEAKNRARDYISNLSPDTNITLISMGKSTRIEENLSNNKNSVINKLNSINVTNGILDIDPAISLITSIKSQYPDTKVVVFGDREIFIDGVDIEFSRVSNDGDNFAITMLSHTKTQQGITALSNISNFSKSDEKVPLSLYVDGRVFDAKNVDIKKGDTLNVYWTNIPYDANIIEVRIDKDDALAIDNTAWNVVNKTNINKVLLVSSGNIFIEKALALSEKIELYKTEPDESRVFEGYDLYIFDGFMPGNLPDDGSIMVFNPTSNKLFNVLEEVRTPTIEELTSDVFLYVKDFKFSIGRTKILEVPLWGQEIIKLSEGSGGFKGTYNNQRVVAVGFNVFNSDISLTPAFPIFMANTVEWLIPSALKNIESVYSGDSIEFNLNPRTEKAYIKSPSGERFTIYPPHPPRVFDNTDEVGVYTLVQDTHEGELSYQFVVNVPASMESDINKALDTISDHTFSKSENVVKTGLNIQFIFIWIIIIFLLIEWWFYKNGV